MCWWWWSGIRKYLSWIQGPKSTGSRIRIHNTGSRLAARWFLSYCRRSWRLLMLMLLSFLDLVLLLCSWWDCAGCDWETGQGWCSQVGRRMYAEVTVQWYRLTKCLFWVLFCYQIFLDTLFRIRRPDYRSYGTGTSFFYVFLIARIHCSC
jgi:hypothetical protein